MNHKKLSRREFLRMSTLTVAGLALAGCCPPAPTPEAAPTEAPSVAPEKRVFKLWHYEAIDSAMGASWDDAQKEFEAMFPDVTVEFELKTFDQIQQTAKMILSSDDVPDVMEINKGNATAGLYSKEGLLADLSEEALARGWDDILSPSIQTTCRYDENGIMGSGKLYGVTNYGEFVMVYYNKDMFAEHGVEVPTSLDEFEAVCDAFVDEGITPIAIGALDKWPVTQNFYEMVLYKADRDLIDAYQLLKADVDFQGPEFTYGAEKLVEQFEKGYYSPDATGIGYGDANAAFIQGTNPMNLTGSWMFGSFLTSITDFDWGLFVMPGKTFNTGSGGNLWVVPENAKEKDLAYEYIQLTLQSKAQTVMANTGGIPLKANLDEITDDHVRELNQAFSTIVANDGLAFYPDWPAPGYMDVLGSGLQELIGGMSVPEFLDYIAGPWQEYKDSLE
jgi:raffinose/stachyose/melibiose transport system substrate-binding protein